MRAIVIGPILGMRTTLLPLFWPAYLALAIVATILAHLLVHLDWGLAILAGVLSALIFMVSEWLHQFGHSLAARWVGHPMLGMRFFNLFSGSEYPADEPALPDSVHVRRALGGFWISLLLGLVSLPVALRLWPQGREILPPGASLIAWLAAFSAFTNLIALGLLALVPMPVPGGGLNDGATILKIWLADRAKTPQN